jgi:hypothetical protein
MESLPAEREVYHALHPLPYRASPFAHVLSRNRSEDASANTTAARVVDSINYLKTMPGWQRSSEPTRRWHNGISHFRAPARWPLNAGEDVSTRAPETERNSARTGLDMARIDAAPRCGLLRPADRDNAPRPALAIQVFIRALHRNQRARLTERSPSSPDIRTYQSRAVPAAIRRSNAPAHDGCRDERRPSTAAHRAAAGRLPS